MSFSEVYQKCRRNWAMFAAVLTGAILMATAYTTVPPALKQLRFWVNHDEADAIVRAFDGKVVTLAEHIYPRTVEDQTLRLAVIKGRINWLESHYQTLDDKSKAELDDFRRQLIQAEKDLTRLSREQAEILLRTQYR
jgi:hypothetical protein